jgi:hypothetical protein
MDPKPRDGELHLLIKVLKNMNLCEQADGDEYFFNPLLTDVSIGITIDQHTQERIRNAIIRNARSAALGRFPAWLAKVVKHPTFRKS